MLFCSTCKDNYLEINFIKNEKMCHACNKCKNCQKTSNIQKENNKGYISFMNKLYSDIKDMIKTKVYNQEITFIIYSFSRQTVTLPYSSTIIDLVERIGELLGIHHTNFLILHEFTQILRYTYRRPTPICYYFERGETNIELNIVRLPKNDAMLFNIIYANYDPDALYHDIDIDENLIMNLKSIGLIQEILEFPSCSVVDLNLIRSERLRHCIFGNEDFLLLVLRNHPQMLLYASEELKCNKEFLLRAIEQDINAHIFEYIPENLKNDFNFVLDAAYINGNIIQFIPIQFRNNRAIILTGVHNKGLLCL